MSECMNCRGEGGMITPDYSGLCPVCGGTGRAPFPDGQLTVAIAGASTEYPLLSCGNKDCTQTFVLMAVYPSWSEDEYCARQSVFVQGGAFFCPYCGKPWRKP